MPACRNTLPHVTQHFSCHKFVKSVLLEFSDMKFRGSNLMFQKVSLFRTQALSPMRKMNINSRSFRG